MDYDNEQYYTRKKIKRCFCIPDYEYVKSNISDVIKQKDRVLSEQTLKNTITNQEATKKTLENEIDEINKQKEEVQKKLDEKMKNLQILNKKKEKIQNEICMKEKKLISLEEEEVEEEKKILKMTVDGTDITWQQVLKITNEIVSMRINYLRKMRRKLKDIGRKYKKANAVQKNDMSKDFDVIAWNGEIINNKSGITQDVVNAYNEAIKKPSWDGQPSLEIYDEDQGKVVFKQEYNLGKMNDYKVALYIPK